MSSGPSSHLSIKTESDKPISTGVFRLHKRILTSQPPDPRVRISMLFRRFQQKGEYLVSGKLNVFARRFVIFRERENDF